MLHVLQVDSSINMLVNTTVHLETDASNKTKLCLLTTDVTKSTP